MATQEAAASRTAHPQISDEVLERLVAAFYSTTIQQMLLVACITVPWGIVFYVHYGRPLILVWTVAAICAAFLRLWANRRYQSMPETHGQPQRWERQALWVVAVTGCVYATGSWILFDAKDHTYNAILMLWFLGLIGGAAVAAAPLKRPAVVYCSLSGFSLAIRMGLGPDPIYYGLGFGAAVATLTFIFFGLQTHKLQVSALDLGMRNQALAKDLQRQVEIAQQANREKSRFLAAASHDLRQPLHALSLFGDALRRRFSGTTHSGDFDRLMQSVSALNTSLHAMLDISRLDAGIVPVHMQPVDLNAIFAALRRVYLERAEAKGLDLRFRATDAWIMADPHLLQRLLGNLVENAIKYTPKGGVLVGVRRRSHGPYQLQIEVRDSGLGIPAAAHDSVFQEFFQLNNPGRDRVEGLGIGLAIVKRLVSLLQMELALKSEPGCGSTFSIRCIRVDRVRTELPAHTGNLRQSARALEGEKLLRNLKVLVVDDEAAIVEALDSLLSSFGARVMTASTAGGAMAHAKTSDFDLAIMDYRLGADQTGLELAAQLHDATGRAFPLLIITGDTNPEEIKRMQSSLMKVCFKPLSTEALLTAIAEVLPEPIGRGPTPVPAALLAE
jgi:signal transduction histidine kinase